MVIRFNVGKSLVSFGQRDQIVNSKLQKYVIIYRVYCTLPILIEHRMIKTYSFICCYLYTENRISNVL